MHHFVLHSHQQHVGVPALPRPRQTLVSVSLFNFSYSKRYVAVSHHSFIYFLNDWHWTPFSALVYHSYLFLCEVSGELFYSFLIVFLLSFGSSLCIPGTSSLLDTCFANIFLSFCSLPFHLVDCFFCCYPVCLWILFFCVCVFIFYW